MNKIDRISIPVHLTEAPVYNWELVREHDGLTKQSVGIIWIEWSEEGRFKQNMRSLQ